MQGKKSLRVLSIDLICLNFRWMFQTKGKKFNIFPREMRTHTASIHWVSRKKRERFNLHPSTFRHTIHYKRHACVDVDVYIQFTSLISLLLLSLPFPSAFCFSFLLSPFMPQNQNWIQWHGFKLNLLLESIHTYTLSLVHLYLLFLIRILYACSTDGYQTTFFTLEGLLFIFLLSLRRGSCVFAKEKEAIRMSIE